MSLSQTKTKLVEAIDLYQHLESEIDNEKDLGSYSEEEWQARLRTLGLDTAKLIQTSRMLDNDNLIDILQRKKKKLVRHSNWKKKHKKRTKQQRKQQIKRSEKWIKDTKWTVTISPSKALVATTETTTSKIISEQDETKKLKAKVKKLSNILIKLSQLTSLRRKKLEAKGHFFSQGGNEFFNQVKEWYDMDQQQQQQQRSNVEDKNDTEMMREQQQQQNKKLIINKQDVWRHIPIDEKAYQYWYESDQSLEGLIKNRKMWDQYIRFETQQQQDDLIHKVPPVFVTPTPPANWVWASYLLLS